MIALSASTRAIRRHAVRSVLTILSIAVGVGLFICVVSVGNAGSEQVKQQLRDLGDNMIWVEAGSRLRNGMRAGSRGTRTLTMEDMRQIDAQVPGIKLSTPNVDGHIQVVYGDNNWSTMYRGVTPEFMEVRRWDIAQGEMFSKADVENDEAVCVIGQTIVDNLFAPEPAVGKVIRVNAMPCKVVGVLRAKGQSATGQDQDDVLLMPITTLQKRITGQFWLDDIFFSASTADDMPEVKREITSILRERHHLRPGEPDDFNIRSPEDLIKAQLATSEAFTILLGGVASLSLLVGGIGIMNIMLVSVTERTREIGIRLAIGATENDIRTQFTAEALMLGAIGGFAGISAALLSTFIFENVFAWKMQVTPGTVLIGALFSLLVGVFFGYYPANRAAQLDPIQALRFE